tara:strand:- start:1065 stop:1400 length:336 start_codon:yes stop_codon:yes gene_type:complete
MRAIKGQAKNLRKNIKQNNIKPLLIVFGVLVMITVTYKSSNGLGNTAFKEGNKPMTDAEREAKNAERAARDAEREAKKAKRYAKKKCKATSKVNHHIDHDKYVSCLKKKGF